VKEEPRHWTKSRLQGIGGDKTFGHDGLAGKILHGPNKLESSRIAAVLGIILIGRDSPGRSSSAIWFILPDWL